MEQRNKTSTLSHLTSYISKHIIHQTSSIRHLNDCEELVKILVARCKKFDQELAGK
ncbi:MAG: hypothetical protein K6D59_06585 [Bacteroidales bacterium]|nr:hypothetical protein [Bacteroidales bacterium]